MYVGNEITLECTAENIKNFYGVAFRVFYDPLFFEISSAGVVDIGEIFSDFPMQSTFAPIEGQNGFVVGLVIDQPMAVNDAPDIGTEQLVLKLIKFLKAIASGTTELMFDAYSIQQPDLKEIPVKWEFPESFEIFMTGTIRLKINFV